MIDGAKAFARDNDAQRTLASGRWPRSPSQRNQGF
jgi:hypothetical protein